MTASRDRGTERRYIAVEYDASAETHYTHRDPEESLAETVIRAVATVADTDPIEMVPLAETVDPDALDRTVDSFPADEQWCLTFEYAGYAVTVQENGRVELSPVE